MAWCLLSSQILIKCLPNFEEIKAVQKYTGDPAKLGLAEQFFLSMSAVPRCQMRLQSFLFKVGATVFFVVNACVWLHLRAYAHTHTHTHTHTYTYTHTHQLRFSSLARELLQKLRIVRSACSALRESTQLKQVLQVVLSVGNFLNEGTHKGRAAGFKLSTLNKLSSTKSVDGKINLLDFIVGYIEKQRLQREVRGGGREGGGGRAGSVPVSHVLLPAPPAPSCPPATTGGRGQARGGGVRRCLRRVRGQGGSRREGEKAQKAKTVATERQPRVPGRHSAVVPGLCGGGQARC